SPVDFQIKGTTAALISERHVRYDLKARNYDLIVTRPLLATPNYLFLICFGPDVKTWFSHEATQLILGASAYWWTDSGLPTANSTTVRIEIPLENRLTSDAIEGMLQGSKERFES